jgi:RNA polymerase sigma-70 factor (ECF subfamily)
MEASEEALMRAYVGGDRSAFADLFRRLAPSVFAFFLRSLRSRAAVEDLVQMTFLKLHRARASWMPDRPLRPWVFAIAGRLRQDELRRAYLLPEAAGEEEIAAAEARLPPSGASEAEEALAERSRAARVRAALEGLPEAQRTVIHLHRFEGLGFAEIAEALGTTEGAVKARAFRGYERLRAELADLIREGE